MKNGIEDTSEFMIISNYFTDEKQLAVMVEMARRNPKTKDMATQFQAGQVGKWLRDGKNPQEVYKLLFVKTPIGQ